MSVAKDEPRGGGINTSCPSGPRMTPTRSTASETSGDSGADSWLSGGNSGASIASGGKHLESHGKARRSYRGHVAILLDFLSNLGGNWGGIGNYHICGENIQVRDRSDVLLLVHLFRGILNFLNVVRGQVGVAR